MPRTEKRLIFVGGTAKPNNDQNPGGVLSSSQALLRNMKLANWSVVPIDSTASSFPPEPLLVKLLKSSKRLVSLVQNLIISKHSITLAFCSDGLSFFEKSLMCLIANILGSKSIIFPRSEYPMTQISETHYPYLYKSLFSIPKRIFCQSPRWVDLIQKLGVPKDKLVIIPNWIDPDEYSKARTSQPDSPDITFIYVGWMIHEKGVMDLFQAIKMIRSKLPGGRWILVGGGTELENLKNLSAQHRLAEQIQFAGWVPHDRIVEQLKRADVFVLPTYAEGFPNVILEAMSSGLPVITTPVGGIPGFIKDGENALLVPPGDPSKLAETMLRLAQDVNLRKRLSQAGLEYVKQVHDQKIVFAKLEQGLEDLLVGR